MTPEYPVIILSHRRRKYLPRAVRSLRENLVGYSEIYVVDDSGDPVHHRWLTSQGLPCEPVHPTRNRGYLQAMERVFSLADEISQKTQDEYVLLWEEDFLLTKPLSLHDMAAIMDEPENGLLAHLNLQRQSVYMVERLHGFMESHVRRGYGLERVEGPDDLQWVRRKRPFTTNPGLIRREILDIPWPSREVSDTIPGGAEPAMSLRLENEGYHFGWFGPWNTPHTRHIGNIPKTGTGY